LVCFAPANRDSSDPGDESSSGTADPEAAFRWGLSQRRVALLTIIVAVGVVIWVGRTPGRGGDLASETTIASCASTAMPTVHGDVPVSVDRLGIEREVSETAEALLQALFDAGCEAIECVPN